VLGIAGFSCSMSTPQPEFLYRTVKTETENLAQSTGEYANPFTDKHG
jgi:hypothetical protein